MKLSFLFAFILLSKLSFCQNKVFGLEEIGLNEWNFVSLDLSDCTIDTISQPNLTGQNVDLMFGEFNGYAASCNKLYIQAQTSTQTGVEVFDLISGTSNFIPFYTTDFCFPSEIEFDQIHNLIYLVGIDYSGGSGACEVYKYNLTSNTGSVVSTLTTGCGGYITSGAANRSTLDPENNMLYTSGEVLLKVDLLNGMVDTLINLDTLSFTFLYEIYFDENENAIFGIKTDSNLYSYSIIKIDLLFNQITTVANFNLPSDLIHATYNSTTKNFTIVYGYSGTGFHYQVYNVINGNLETSCLHFNYGFPLYYNQCLANDISYINNDYKINLYPNPATNQITVESAKTINAIEITNSLGVTVYAESVNLKSKIINLKSFPSGIYFIKLYFGDGGMEVKKFVRE